MITTSFQKSDTDYQQIGWRDVRRPYISIDFQFKVYRVYASDINSSK
jgi:hypothetical protein